MPEQRRKYDKMIEEKIHECQEQNGKKLDNINWWLRGIVFTFLFSGGFLVWQAWAGESDQKAVDAVQSNQIINMAADLAEIKNDVKILVRNAK